MIDLDAWEWMDKLSQATGDAAYAKLADDMARCFTAHGFDDQYGPTRVLQTVTLH